MSAARADTGVEGEGCIVTRAGRADLTEPVPPAREPSRRPTPTASRKPVGSCHGAWSLGGADRQRPDGGAGGSSTRWRPGQEARHLGSADSRRAPPRRAGLHLTARLGGGGAAMLSRCWVGCRCWCGQIGALSILAKGHTFTSQLGWRLNMSGPLPPHHLRLNVLAIGAAVDEVLGEKGARPRAMVE